MNKRTNIDEFSIPNAEREREMKKRGGRSIEAELVLEHFKKQVNFPLQALHYTSECQISISHQAVHTYALKC